MMDNISQDDFMEKVEKTVDKAVAVQVERNKYLGELKERVIVALTKDQVNENLVYEEVESALEEKNTKYLIMSRNIELTKIKKYIRLADKYNVKYKTVDGLEYRGDIGLVVVSNNCINKSNEDIIVKNITDEETEDKLPKSYYEAFGEKICKFHMDVVREKIPGIEKRYNGEIGTFESLFLKCPICEKLGGKKRG